MIAFRKRAAFSLLAVGLLAGLAKSASADDWLDRVARFLGISKTPSQLKGPAAKIDTADIYVTTGGDVPVRLTVDGGYRSPIFLPGDAGLLALKGDIMVQIPLSGGAVRKLQTVPHALKLLGVDAGDADRVLVLLEGSNGSELGVLTLDSGQITRLPYDPESKPHRRMMGHLRGDNREYDGVAVYVQSESRARLGGQLEWTDVYVRRADQTPVNVSRCDGSYCGQPALSPDGKRIAFVKADARP